MKALPLKDKVVIITGASGGIGEALARAFDAEGAIVVLAARSKAKLEQLAVELSHPLILPTDLGDVEAATGMVNRTFQQFGKIDILINNAAAIIVSPAETVSPDDLIRSFTVNMVSPAAATQRALQFMKAAGHGHIINIGSPGFMMGIPFYAPYVCSKAAFSAWTRTIQAEWAGSGISVSEYFPGYIKTPTPPESRIGPVDQDFLMAKDQNFISRIFTRPQLPATVARHVVKLAIRPKTLAFSGFGVRLGTFISNMPSFRLSIATQMARNAGKKMLNTEINKP